MAEDQHGQGSHSRYPSDTCPEPGWWRASDGKWYPPEAPGASGWSIASDGRWNPPLSAPPATPKWVYWGGLLWLVFLVAWMPAVGAMQSSGAHPADIQRIGFEVGAVAALATLAFGGALGWRSLWREVRIATLIGASVLVGVPMLWAMVSLTDEGETNGTGAEVIIFFYPFAVVAVGALLYAAAGTTAWLQRTRDDR